MGVNLSDIVPKQKISFEALEGRKIAIDAYNALYQFLSIIRQPDGTPLMDSKGRITSHLSGIFYRTAKFLEAGILPVYVFDGEPPEEKKITIEKRIEMREISREKWREMIARGDVEEARKYAQAAVFLEREMVEDVKSLLSAMGVPWVQAPSEGEAQAAYMCSRGDVWASASQDYDSLLFGSPRVVRNLTISGRRKLPNKNVYVEVEPEIISLDETLNTLGITREQLIHVAILIGTDYNEGIKGIGPKKALTIVKSGRIKEYIPEEQLQRLTKLFLEPSVTENYSLVWNPPDKEKVLKILVDEHDFSLERVQKVLGELTSLDIRSTQSKLEMWFS